MLEYIYIYHTIRGKYKSPRTLESNSKRPLIGCKTLYTDRNQHSSYIYIYIYINVYYRHIYIHVALCCPCHPCPFQALDKYCLSPQNKAFAPGGSDAVRILCSGVYPVAVGLINSVVTGGVWEFVIQWYVLMSDIIPQFQKDLVHFIGGPVWRADAPARGHWNLLSSRINVSGINMFYLVRKVANTYVRMCRCYVCLTALGLVDGGR